MIPSTPHAPSTCAPHTDAADDLSVVAALAHSVGNCLQSYSAARTYIRDYVISGDPIHFERVEHRVETATAALSRASSLACASGEGAAILQLHDSINEWNARAHALRDAFAHYSAVAQHALLNNFHPLAAACRTVGVAHAPRLAAVASEVLSAHCSVSAYLVSGAQDAADAALRAVEAAHDKFCAACNATQQLDFELSTFGRHLEKYAASLAEAVRSRADAYRLLDDDLAPMGEKIQTEAEALHRRLTERQRRQDEFSSALANDLRHAVENAELVMYYQPKLNLRTGAADHLEALVRWMHPQRGTVPPNHFIAAAEHAGCIGIVTRFAIESSLRQWARWNARGLAFHISINISARDLLDPQLVPWIAGRLKAEGVRPECITLEVTETAVMREPDECQLMLQALRNLGLRLSIDDFGTGYSSLAYLGTIPAHELKIDKSFVQAIVGEREKEAITRSTIDLGHDLGLTVVGEGVEDGRTMDLLKALGCDFAQGYFISAPVPSHALEGWIAARGQACAAACQE